MANHFIGRTPDGVLYRATTVNTSKLGNEPKAIKEIQRGLLNDDVKACQLCLNKLAEANGLETIPVLEAPSRYDILNGSTLPLLHREELDINQYGSLLELWDNNRSKLCVHFRANQEHQESSVGHGKRHTGRSVDSNETAQAIINELSKVGRFSYSYQLIQTKHCKRPVIVIKAVAEDGTLAKRIVVYELAAGRDYYSAVSEVLTQTIKDDGVQDRLILSVAMVERNTYAGKLRSEFKYHPAHLSFVQRTFADNEPQSRLVAYKVLPPIDVEDGTFDETIGGSGASGELHCSTAEADDRQAATGVRQFASSAERLNYYSGLHLEVANSSARVAEFELMDNAELETITNYKHGWYGTDDEVSIASGILESRRVTNDERLLNNAVSQLKQYQFTDASAVRKIGEDAPMLKKVAADDMWAHPSDEYEALGLGSYLKEAPDLTFAALSVAQGRIEDISTLMRDTMRQLQSKRFAHLHFDIKALGHKLCALMAPTPVDAAGALDY